MGGVRVRASTRRGSGGGALILGPSRVRPLAEGVGILSWAFPPAFFNAYLLDDVLVDAGNRQAARGFLRALRGRDLSAVALTHVHPDHTGSAARLCAEFDLPLWCGERDAAALEDGSLNYPVDSAPHRVAKRVLAGAPVSVARGLREGDRVGSFVVLETPGHSPGHVSFWRESDRVLIAGEVASKPWFRIKEPLGVTTADAAEARRSVRRLAELRPTLVCFCHGRPLSDGRRFVEFAAQLPA